MTSPAELVDEDLHGGVGMNESLRREIEQYIRELRQEQRELSIIDDKREYWRLAGEIKGLKRVLGARSYKDHWMLRNNSVFGQSETGRCGYCGGTVVDKSSNRPAVIRIKCLECGFEDEKDVS